MFRAALADVNGDMQLAPKKLFAGHTENLTRDDSLAADWKTCGLLQRGVVAIVGPLAGSASDHVQAICDSLEVPHIETGADFAPGRADLAIRLHPSAEVLARAYIDVIRAWNWSSFAVVYESSSSMVRMQDLFGQLGAATNRKWAIRLFQVPQGKQFREVFRQVKRTDENNIILDVSGARLFEAMKHAQQVGMMTERQSYLLASLDAQTIELDDFKYGQTRIAALQLVDRHSGEFARMLDALNNEAAARGSPRVSRSDVLLESVLIYDAVHLLARAVNELDAFDGSSGGHSLSCSDLAHTWPAGSSLVNFMRAASFQGATGVVKFDQFGSRSGLTLDVLLMFESGLERVGKWHELANASLVVEPQHESRFFGTQLYAEDTLVVTTKRTQPYFMLKATPNKQEGNDQYEGYAVDIIHELSRLVGFKYRFKEVDDGKYGVKEQHPNGSSSWNGMIGEIISGKADLAIVDLTITSARQDAVDFTLPFMNTGISILFKKPTNKATTLFSFLSPFSKEVWTLVICAYTGVSMVLFFVGRMSPYEWHNPYPCRQEGTAELVNSFSLLNAFWFTIGSLMQQGSDIAPKSMATRTMAGIWYFFTLIMISSYTANLAAFLTVEKIVYPIESAKDLSEQTEIKYGCVESGTTMTFFRDSQIDTYQRIYSFMDKYKTYVKSNEEGKERVEQGNFAFFMESTSIEYITERNCNLTQIGSPLDSKNYGIATSKISRHRRNYRNLLSDAILQLQENGMLHMLKNRWWKERHGVGSCGDDAKGGGVTELSLANVGGVFVVLLGGMGLAFLLAFLESCAAMPSGQLDRNTRLEMMRDDFRFAISCAKSQRPPNRDRQDPDAFDDSSVSAYS